MMEKQLPLNEMIEKFFELQTRKKEISDFLKETESQIELIEKDIISAMENAGIDQARCSAGSVTVKTEIYPSVRDKELFVIWCVNNNAFEFLQSRVNAAPYRERLALGQELPPGIETYEKQTLLRRKL